MTRPTLSSLRRLQNVKASLTDRCTPAVIRTPCHRGYQAPTITQSNSSSSALVPPERCDSSRRSTWFTSNPQKKTALEGRGDHEPPDERTLQLGKTIRILHERLPTLLKEPLPSEILSPQITLHLFPSTHPHLPTVSGRIAYVAALWTAPVAWGRVPLVGNVKLIILSERLVGNSSGRSKSTFRSEKLIVKWKTCGKTTHRDGSGGIYRGIGIAAKDPVEKIKDFIAGTASQSKATPSAEQVQESEEFCGIFIFEFDEQGRIVKHTIEHTEEGGQYDHMTRVVSVTDWLIGTFNGKRKQEPALAWCAHRCNDWRSDKRRRA